eukprot:756021-Hanusia_phi.AAC.3
MLSSEKAASFDKTHPRWKKHTKQAQGADIIFLSLLHADSYSRPSQQLPGDARSALSGRSGAFVRRGRDAIERKCGNQSRQDFEAWEGGTMREGGREQER